MMQEDWTDWLDAIATVCIPIAFIVIPLGFMLFLFLSAIE